MNNSAGDPYSARMRSRPLIILSVHSLFAANFCANSMYMFADDATVVGQILNNDKTECSEEMESLVTWCQENNLSHNASKMKMLVTDSRNMVVYISQSASKVLMWRWPKASGSEA